MTAEEEHEFCQAAALGIACGLAHRYEWLNNALRSAEHGDYNKFTESSNALMNAFVSFEKTTAGSPEEDKELTKLTPDILVNKINNWYKRQK